MISNKRLEEFRSWNDPHINELIEAIEELRDSKPKEPVILDPETSKLEKLNSELVRALMVAKEIVESPDIEPGAKRHWVKTVDSLLERHGKVKEKVRKQHE